MSRNQSKDGQAPFGPGPTGSIATLRMGRLPASVPVSALISGSGSAASVSR